MSISLRHSVPLLLSAWTAALAAPAKDRDMNVDLIQDLNWQGHHFAMTNWFYRYKWNDPAAQIAILAERGYDSVMLSLKDDPKRWKTLPAYLAALKKHNMRLAAIHARFYIEDGTYPRVIKDNLPLLKDTKVVLVPSVGSRKKMDRKDPKAAAMAVKVLREMSDDAKRHGLGGIAPYMHIGNWIETIDDNVRIARAVGRRNVGVMFHLHHWQAVGNRDLRKLREDLIKARPYLMIVVIQGTDTDKATHKILGEGSFDMAPLVRTLGEMNYQGPLGTMGYTQSGDIPGKLDRAYRAWEKIKAAALRSGIAPAGGKTRTEAAKTQIGYARSLLDAAGKRAELRLVQELGHREAFRITVADGPPRIAADSPAGLVYGAQAMAHGELHAGQIQKPDFDIRGTMLWLGGAVQGRRIAPYHSGFDWDSLPWFFDRAFMTRYLDKLASARFNTLFLWASHPFPYLLDLPEYPGATKLRPEQLRRNQQQFRWLVSECGRRNIRVLLHFYNIHLPDGLREKFGAHASWGASAVKNPSPEIAKYYRYVLGRYFEDFDNVGLYICPGETLATSRQLEWFRDVIFKAAKESGNSPLLIIRDWTLNMDFRKQIPALYENCYSELKHNDESFTSPVPDRRHQQWRNLLKGHVVNLHGPPMDVQPMRWASPVLIHETVGHWHDMGYVKGAEIYALSCFDWPYTQDKLTGDQFGYREQVKGPKLLWIDRSGIYLDTFGRYLWKTDRGKEGERGYWQRYLAEKFHSPQVGKHLYRWYVSTGPISPGMQNLTATKFGNFWATVMLQNQDVDQILKARERIGDVPITLTRETGRTRQVYYSQPVDEYFFQRYKDRFGLGEPAGRISMPVAQYANELLAGCEVTKAMTPEKVCDLLCELADEAMESARAARAAATDPNAKAELDRFVTDSRMYVLATRAFRHKVCAAILKARMLQAADAKSGGEFIRRMEQSVKVYEDLAKLTGQTYRNANDLMGRHWKREGLAEFRKDLTAQRAWLAGFQKQSKAPGE